MTTVVNHLGARADITTRKALNWRVTYARRIFATDLLVLCSAVFAALLIRFGIKTSATTASGVDMPYATFGVLLLAGWMLGLQASGARDERLLGTGFLEYRRVVSATVFVFGILAILSVLFKWDVSRGYLAIAFPAGLVGLVTSRRLWRAWLAGERRQGRALSSVMLVGGLESGREIVTRFARSSRAGMSPVGIWVPDGSADGVSVLVARDSRALPVLGSEYTLDQAIAQLHPSMVVVTDSEHMGPNGLRELTWRLEGSDIELMIAPNVFDVASARLHLTEVGSVALLHLDEPTYASAAQWPKVIFDRCMALALCVLASPLLLATAVAVKVSSPGPVLYRQERIGMDGRPFQMLKFRSMRQDADHELHMLLQKSGQDLQPLAKLQDDPRVTRVGRFIRRFSIDELPQLVNVLKGDMSLVGPRPQRSFEVEAYDEVAHRRLRVRPGLTGLWQISGRSDLPWDEAVRLDTYYVANWSMTTDLIILWRTARAVAARTGAY